MSTPKWNFFKNWSFWKADNPWEYLESSELYALQVHSFFVVVEKFRIKFHLFAIETVSYEMNYILYLLFQRHLTTGSRARSTSRTTGVRYPTSYHVVCCKRMISTINDGYNNPSLYIFLWCDRSLFSIPKYIQRTRRSLDVEVFWCLFQGVYPHSGVDVL